MHGEIVSRKKIIAGNWKMNFTSQEAEVFLKKLVPLVKANMNSEIILCVPFVDIELAKRETAGTNIKIGAQNCYFEKSGAFTGEISAEMLRSLGVEYVILGHSERRTYFLENDKIINKKVKAALDENLKAIVCVGETAQQKEWLETNEVIFSQVSAALQGIKAEDLKNIIFAYEPMWSIGTGKAANFEIARRVCAYIKKIVKNLYEEQLPSDVATLYGGSVNAKNVNQILSKDTIDGGLIGGASLDVEEFSEIINIAEAIL